MYASEERNDRRGNQMKKVINGFDPKKWRIDLQKWRIASNGRKKGEEMCSK